MEHVMMMKIKGIQLTSVIIGVFSARFINVLVHITEFV